MYILTITVFGETSNAVDVRECVYLSDAFLYARKYLDRLKASIERGITYSVSNNKWHKINNVWKMSATSYENKEDTDGVKIMFTIEDKE